MLKLTSFLIFLWFASASAQTGYPVPDFFGICLHKVDPSLFAIGGICEKFYRCFAGTLFEHRCPSGLAFNPTIMVCDYPYNVPGCAYVTSDPPITITFETERETNGDVFVTINETEGRGNLTLVEPADETTAAEIVETAPSFAPVGTTAAEIVEATPSFVPDETTAAEFVENAPSFVSDGTTAAATVETTASFISNATMDFFPVITETTTTATAIDETYVGFVLDNTGSKATELSAIRAWILLCIFNPFARSHVTECALPPTGGWLATTFNDPSVGAVVGPTTNAGDLFNFVNNLNAFGGGNCPELSLTGISNLVNRIPLVNRGCKIYFFTDAIPREPESKFFSVYLEFLNRGCAFIPVLTGCCGRCEDPCLSVSSEFCENRVTDRRGSSISKRETNSSLLFDPPEKIYYQLASLTNGAIYLTDFSSSTSDLFTLLSQELTQGFCPTSAIAGPLPEGFTNEQDCESTGSCWDRTFRKCFCSSPFLPCPRSPLFRAPICRVTDIHTFLPDPMDCTMYYECASGRQFRRPCAPGTVFDPAVGVCNHPFLTAPPCGTKVN